LEKLENVEELKGNVWGRDIEENLSYVKGRE
jgi:hypothetical protein